MIPLALAAAGLCAFCIIYLLPRGSSSEAQVSDREIDVATGQPEPEPAGPVEPDARVALREASASSDAGTSGSELVKPPTASERFVKEQTESTWAAAQEHALSARLRALDNPFLDLLGVECRSSCCRVALSFEWMGDDDDASRLAYNAVLLDLQSAVGFGAWAKAMQLDGGTTDETTVTMCFDRELDTLALPTPDRLAERRALLEQSLPTLRGCISSGTARFVSLLAVVEADGSVRVKNNYSGSMPAEVSACVLRVIESWTLMPTGHSEFLSVATLLSR